VCQCQYSIIRAPRATSAQAAWRHWPSNAGRLSQVGPMCMALVSVTRKGAWREENIQSAVRYSDQTPAVFHFCSWSAGVGSGSARPSCIT
jgi:hypothetical protein